MSESESLAVPDGPKLVTPRLFLRPPRKEDFPAWAELNGDPQTMEHLGGVQHEADAWRGFNGFCGAWALGYVAMFSVVERETGNWVGRIGPHRPHLWPVKEVGWGLHPAYVGKGYALEAAIASVDFAFDDLGWPTVSHLINDQNTRSAKLAERLGASPVGPSQMPGSLSDEQVTEWRQSREEWRARRASFDGLVPR